MITAVDGKFLNVCGHKIKICNICVCLVYIEIQTFHILPKVSKMSTSTSTYSIQRNKSGSTNSLQSVNSTATLIGNLESSGTEGEI